MKLPAELVVTLRKTGDLERAREMDLQLHALTSSDEQLGLDLRVKVALECARVESALGNEAKAQDFASEVMARCRAHPDDEFGARGAAIQAAESLLGDGV